MRIRKTKGLQIKPEQKARSPFSGCSSKLDYRDPQKSFMINSL